MDKKILPAFLLLISSFCVSAQAQINETATDAVKNMGVGWNLGNTLDASSSKAKDPSSATYWNGQGLESENCWGQATTTFKLMTMMKNAGFGAIRVPVTWYNHMDKDGKVNAQWMKRVHEVVDYVIDNGMYCILNVHHDTGADSDSHISWIKADETNYNNNKARYEYLWKQIAEEFKNYDKHLVFEAYNEMLDSKSSWCYASFNATNKYDSSLATSAYNGLNGYAQSFVNTVRATGGNNATRNLIINTYAAANGYGTWSSHLKEPLTKMNMPEDNVSGHIIFEVHDYPALTNNGSNRTLTDIKNQINGMISGLKSNLPKGAPIIIGEWGTSNVDAGTGKTDYDVRRTLMLQFVDAYVKACKTNNIAPFYWMGLTDGQYRGMAVFSQADLAEKMVKAYHGSSFEGEFPVVQPSSEVVVFEGDKLISNWGVQVSVGAELFDQLGEGVQLEIAYKQESGGDDIQLYYSDWSSKPTFKVDGKSYSGDFNPGKVYNTPVGTEHTTVFTFDASTYKTLRSKGLIVFGDGWRLKKMRLYNPTTDISTVKTDTNDDAYYNLSGQRVLSPTKGIYIKGGKKIYVK